MAQKLQRLITWIEWILTAAAALVLFVALGWLGMELRWGSAPQFTSAETFHYGTIGLELMPLKFVLAMDKVMLDDRTSAAQLFARRIHAGKPWPTNWPQDYGFLQPDTPAPANSCESGNDDENRAKLPVGFTISHRLPGSAAPVPVRFVGLACSLCHSTRLHTPDGKRTPVIYGAGNPALDLLAWSDGLQNVLLDPRLTADKIMAGYESKCGSSSGPAGFLQKKVETFLISSWLSGFRGVMQSNISKYDLPYAGAELLDSHFSPAGPNRTRPFRSVIRTVLDVPAETNQALSKIPAIADQHLKKWSQYDGSLGDSVSRSSIAANTSGASVEALAQPEIASNIQAAAGFTENAGADAADPAQRIPLFADLFPENLDRTRAKAGFPVYQQHCAPCHGYRPIEGGAWQNGDPQLYGRVMDVVGETQQFRGYRLGTDPDRVVFRYNDILPLSIRASFPAPPGKALEDQRDELSHQIEASEASGRSAQAARLQMLLQALDAARRKYPAGHPLHIAPGIIRQTNGYINAPISMAYLRAPYLHNASVPDLAQLINLDPRQKVFCRGDNDYDPGKAGLIAPAPRPSGTCEEKLPFLFDTSAPGNSNLGHDFPWTAAEVAKDPKKKQQLADLLEYLKLL